jgi:heme/copper-type cytochrome/quinol oxidase subunit 1
MALGLDGMARRIATYPGGFGEEGWATTNTIITVASFVAAVSVFIFLYNLVVSFGSTGRSPVTTPRAATPRHGRPPTA